MTMVTDPDVTALSSVDVADMVGVSYRMLDYWLREGHITLGTTLHPGSGRRRTWTVDEVNALELFVAEYRRILLLQEDMRNGRVWEQVIREAEAASAA